MGLCKCSDGLGNTGTVACLGDIANTKKTFVVPTYNELGVKNKILISTTLNPAWLTGLLNDTTDTRLRPISDLENVTDVRAAAEFQTAASGRKAYVRDGVRSFTAELWGSVRSASEYLGILKGMKCTEMSVYLLDLNNNFIGEVPATEDGYLYPIRIDSNSWEAVLTKATDSTKQLITLTFDFHKSAKDENLRMFTESEYTCDFEAANGLLDINAEFSAVGINGLTVELTTIFGTAKTKQPLTGLVVGDFALYNVTDSAAVVLATSTETSDGVYALTWVAAQTITDLLRLTPTKNGYDFSTVIAQRPAVA